MNFIFSFFYSKLSKKHKNDDKTKPETEQEYLRVKSWTKKIDIFEKRMLIIPICEGLHWYVVIVCNPGHVLSQSHEKHNPYIMVLDSFGK